MPRPRPAGIGQVADPGPWPAGSRSPGPGWIGHTSRVGQHDAGPGVPHARLGVRGNLPAEISSFVGRAGDLARCADLLRRGRLLTLTGAGGAGKTRLALRLAAMLAAGFPGGAWWIDLAPLTGPEAVTGAVARAVPAVPAGADLDTMADALGEVEALLLLDNCEHLGAGVPELVDRLLRGTRALQVLATSRAVLEVEGEIVWRVHPLAVPPARAREAELRHYDAARLFLERAGHARPDVRPQAADVVAVCRQLDGLPLALELAAARFRTATMTQILNGLDDRFALLARRGGTAPSRQRTLLASVQWSHDLLTPPGQVLLRRLSVFAGGWTLQATRTVTGFPPLEPDQVGDLLAGLVDASMVQLEDAAGAGRYRLLETIRAYAAARLADAGETAELAGRHLEWAAGLAQGLEAGTAAADPSALGQLDAEVANLHAALDHAASAAPASHAGLRLVAALGFFWVHRGYALAGDDRATRAIETAPDAPAWLRARAVQAHAYTCFYGADLDTARTGARAALELAGAPGQEGSGPADPRTVGRAHQLLAALNLLDDLTACRDHLTAALRAARQAQDSWAEIEILQTFALSFLVQRAAPGASGFEHDLADVLALQDPAVGCRCFGEGVGRVDARLDLVLLPEREDRLEFCAQDSHLPPEVADVDAADRPVLVHQLQRRQQRDAGHLGGEAGGAAALPAGQVGETERDHPAARPQQFEPLPPVIAAERVQHDVHALPAG